MPSADLLPDKIKWLEETRAFVRDGSALAEELPRVYEELRRLAASHLRNERAEHTLQPTALVHEAYLRMIEQRRVDWSNRPQFFAVAAHIMRRILVKHAIRRNRNKRGGGVANVSLDAAVEAFDQEAVPLVALNHALADLERIDQRQARIVELRFFAGLSIDDTAEALGISPATVKREWTVAKHWLAREMA
jgi:RNA polymerase sigma factor (TIGR02999 family)